MVGLAERFQISLVLLADMDERKVLGKYVVLELCPLIPAQAENIIRFELNFIGVLFVLTREQSLQKLTSRLPLSVIFNQVPCTALLRFLFIRSKGIGENRFLDDWNHHP